jgi:hypothetical protein
MVKLLKRNRRVTLFSCRAQGGVEGCCSLASSGVKLAKNLASVAHEERVERPVQEALSFSRMIDLGLKIRSWVD